MSERLLSLLRPNPANPRKQVRDGSFDELVASISVNGVLTPLLITPSGLILAGHRRYEAAKDVGLTSVPVRVLDEIDPEDNDLIALIENLLRSDLSVLEVAAHLDSLRTNRSMDAVDISDATGISPGTVRNYLKIADADDAIKERLGKDELSIGAALALINCDDDGLVSEILDGGAADLRSSTVRQKIREVRTGKLLSQLGTTKQIAIREHIKETREIIKQQQAKCPVKSLGRRIYENWLRELDEHEELLDISDKREAISRAWDSGARTELDFAHATGLDRLEIRRMMVEMSNEGLYYPERRPWKAGQARGATEIFWHKKPSMQQTA